MTFTTPFSRISKNDALTAGGKGASLGEMTQASITVPPGFVVLTSAFERFLAETDLSVEIDSILHTVNHEEMHTVENASEKIQALIKSALMPKDIAQEIEAAFKELGAEWVAVRSSATAEDGASAAWAGQLDSFLNTQASDLLEKVQRCWASLFTPRAIFYRFEKDLHKQKISVAVVVQKMIESEVSGIAFSVHPVTEDRNQLIIEAGFGLGEAIVSGQVTPNSYVVEKNPRRVIDMNVSTQTRGLYRVKTGGNEWLDIPEPKASSQALTETQILNLSQMILDIENHYGFPCDIEWAMEGGVFYITQSRPITTLTARSTQSYGATRKEYKFMWGQKQSAMVAEAMILNFAVDNELFSVTKGIDDVMREHNKGFSHIYFSEDAIARGFANGDVYLTEANTKAIFDHIESTIKEFHALVDDLLAATDTKLTNEELLTLLMRYRSTLVMLQKLFRASDPSATSKIEERAQKNLLKYVPQERLAEVFSVLCSSSELDKTQEELIAWKELMDSGTTVEDKTLLKHIRSFPANFCNTWSYDEMVQHLHERIATTNREELDVSVAEIRKSKEELLEQQKDLYKEYSNPELFRDTTILQKLGTSRFVLKHCWSGAETLVLPFFQVLALRIGVPFDVFMWGYNFTDLAQALSLKAPLPKEELEKRLEFSLIHYQGDELKYLYGKEAKEYFGERYTTDTAGVEMLKGITARPGRVTGRARVVLVEDYTALVEASKEFEKGDILVTTMTSPTMMQLAQKASAIVTNEGGITSHAAIIAREFGIPCLVGTHDATRVFKTGDIILVDADSGFVKKVAE